MHPALMAAAASAVGDGAVVRRNHILDAIGEIRRAREEIGDGRAEQG